MTSDQVDLRNLPAHLYIEEMLLPEWRRRRQKEIDDAVNIIRPKPQQRDVCREDVEREGLRLFCAVGWLRSKDQSKTKEGKAAAARLYKVLRRLEAVLEDETLGIIGAAAVTRHMSRDEIQSAARFCEEVQNTPTGKLTRNDAEAKRRAVHCAHVLLTKYNKREAANASKGSPFCKLAVVLYGKPGADLHHQCLAALREKRGAK